MQSIDIQNMFKQATAVKNETHGEHCKVFSMTSKRSVFGETEHVKL
jgi:hypothetical protein